MSLRNKILAARKQIKWTCPETKLDLVYTDISRRQQLAITVGAYQKYPEGKPESDIQQSTEMIMMRMVIGLKDSEGTPVADSLDEMMDYPLEITDVWGSKIMGLDEKPITDEDVEAIDQAVKKRD